MPPMPGHRWSMPDAEPELARLGGGEETELLGREAVGWRFRSVVMASVHRTV